MPQVSVIIPTHNRSEFLRSAIASVLSQAYQDFELIVVDDASTDTTAEVVASFNDERIKFIRHETNQGGSAARNTGIRNSKGDYIAFLDDDDEWLPEKLSKQVQVLLSSPPEVACVYTGWLDVDRSTGSILAKHIPSKRGNLSKGLTAENSVGSTSAVLLKRACLRKVGLFDEDLPCSQDYDLWIRLSKEFLFECVPEPLFKYCIHQNKISTNLDGSRQGIGNYGGKVPRLSVIVLPSENISISGSCAVFPAIFTGEGKLSRRAIRLFPFQLKAYLDLCLTLFGPQAFAKAKAIIWNARSFFTRAGDHFEQSAHPKN